jgi:Tannase and feruloyl esterase
MLSVSGDKISIFRGGTMKRRPSCVLLVHATVCSIAIAVAQSASAATACGELSHLMLPDTKITLAERVPAGDFNAPGVNRPLAVPALCRVAGVVTPAIKFEVWLPEGSAWNGRFQAVGGGGLAGVISYSALAEAVRGGYASASTDTGHEASDQQWVYDRQRVVDYGYRAIHEMTLKAKAVIDAHYGAAPEYAYFNGCSTGGRQGLMEAQRFPDDYDGIVSGAPVNRFTNLHMGQLWTAHATLKKPGAALSREDLTNVSNAVLAQCDAHDGVKDGMLTDPRACHVDVSKLPLTAPQIEAIKLIYQGAVNPRTGVQIYPGLELGGEGPQPGNPGWSLIMNGKEPFAIDKPVLGGMGFGNPDWDWRTFDFDRDAALVDAKLFGTLNAINPDLGDFKAHGGKLIVYHGWSDPGVMPQQTLDYVASVIDFAGKATGGDGRAFTDEYLRLYMLPGVGHCRGGVGPDQADWIAALAGWVENGKAPTRITARREDEGKTVMTRPLCPHPQAARYTGRGDTNDAANFECALPK